MRASLKVKHVKHACLPASKPSKTWKGNPRPRTAEVPHQCEPSGSEPTRMQYNWAAYGLGPIEKP